MARKDLTGRRFGRLVALAPTEERYRTSVMWLCRCDCGRECLASTDRLLNGNVRSCGCLQDESRRLDIAGQRRGRLTALHPTDQRRNGKTVWAWRCDCGQIVYKPPSMVRDGMSTMCSACSQALKKDQAEAMRQVIERDPDTGVAVGFLPGIREGKLARNNTSGVRGVSWHAGTQKWWARIQDHGRTRSLGYYDTLEEAAKARAEAVRRRYGAPDAKDPPGQGKKN